MGVDDATFEDVVNTGFMLEGAQIDWDNKKQKSWLSRDRILYELHFNKLYLIFKYKLWRFV
jgi:hypothetical protein